MFSFECLTTALRCSCSLKLCFNQLHLFLFLVLSVGRGEILGARFLK